MPWLHPSEHTCWPAASLSAECRGVFVPVAAADDIDSAWQALRRREPALFDGEVLHVADVDLEAGLIRCERGRYRHVAVRAVGVETGMRALGVSGAVLSGDRVLIARRAEVVHLYPGRWELAPSGSASPPPDAIEQFEANNASTVDLIGSLMAELHEEAGLSAEANEATPMLFAYDAITKSYDACYAVRFAEAGPASPGPEYELLEWRTIAESIDLGAGLIPVSRMMLERLWL
jgi:hypothetical protein